MNKDSVEMRGSKPCEYLGENFLGRGTSRCKGPKVEVWLACLRKGAPVARTEQARRQ